MSELIEWKDYILIKADYKNPELHKHWATHMILSLGADMEWTVGENTIRCRGICINSDVMHTGVLQKEGALVYLFAQISPYSRAMEEYYLQGKAYSILSDNIVDEMLKKYFSEKDGEKSMLQLTKLKGDGQPQYEERVQKALNYIRNQTGISQDSMDQLSAITYLSKSRLSHLFKEQTGMTLHSYLAFEKLRKTHQYLCQGNNITRSCMMAGFNSPSHCSATCKRMFGIAIHDVYKTIATK